MNQKINYKRIDHLAIAVEDIEKAIGHYCDSLGMTLVERRKTEGERTGMLSAVIEGGDFSIVLVQGTSDLSQVTRYIEHFGPGVQHVAFEVDDIEKEVKGLTENGMDFATDLLQGPGLRQIFSRRDQTSGMMYELIERTGEDGFQDGNVNNLFLQLESSDAY